MKRRELIGAAGLGLAALGLSACKQEEQQAPTTAAKSQQQRFEWKMVTAWPKNFPALGTGAQRFADIVTRMSGGRLTIKVFAGGELVPPMEVFDAVSRGTAEIGHGAAYYWKGKVAAATFFTTVPFGLSAQEMNAWLHKGGGQALWDEAYAPFGVKPFACGNSGMQMGGWFNKRIDKVEDLAGLKIRMPGLGGEVLAKLGATPVIMPGSEIFTALQTGAIDATEWIGPYNDLAFGLHKAASYYYAPGWQEPQAVLELLINQTALNQLPDDLAAIVVEAARSCNADMLDDFTFNNAQALQSLKTEGVEFAQFPDEVIKALRTATEEVLDDFAAQSDLGSRIWASMKAFRAQASELSALTEKALYNWR